MRLALQIFFSTHIFLIAHHFLIKTCDWGETTVRQHIIFDWLVAVVVVVVYM